MPVNACQRKHRILGGTHNIIESKPARKESASTEKRRAGWAVARALSLVCCEECLIEALKVVTMASLDYNSTY